MLLLFCMLLLSVCSGYRCWGYTNASVSDGGRLTMIANGDDAYISFVSDLKMESKIHWIYGVVRCQCIGNADIMKINQLDYAVFKNFVFSYAVYSNPGSFYDRVACGFDADEVQDRTSLKFNGLPLAPKITIPHRDAHFDTRVDGIMLAQGINDFITHSYVHRHKKTIYETDVSGGIFFTMETMFIRPCALWPTYLPFITSTGRPIQEEFFKYTEAVSDVYDIPYFDNADAQLFNSIIDHLKEEKLITDEHEENLYLNMGAREYLRTFSFDTVFIPHRYVHEFYALLVPFAITRLSPDLYVPYIFQAMWPPEDWAHLGKDNTTLYRPENANWLHTCAGTTVEETMKDANTKLASDIYYFAHYCGSYYDVWYVVEQTSHTVAANFYKVMFYMGLVYFVLRFLYKNVRDIRKCMGRLAKRAMPCCYGYKPAYTEDMETLHEVYTPENNANSIN